MYLPPDAAAPAGLRAHLVGDGVPRADAGQGDLFARRLHCRLNARVRMAPDALWAAARTAWDQLAQTHGAVAVWEEVERFSPARPEPTHRMEE